MTDAEVRRALATRCKSANEVIQAIASAGRRHFWSDAYERTSRFQLEHGGLFYIDHLTGLKMAPLAGRWTGFTGGITAKAVIFALAEFIERGKLVPASIFQQDFGYGSAMPDVVAAVGRTGAVEK